MQSPTYKLFLLSEPKIVDKQAIAFNSYLFDVITQKVSCVIFYASLKTKLLVILRKYLCH
ncbi:hypothetical protein H1P_1530012 [Hyella patelloides LEGE 07179]|uniref:Uncharacterized protein n=1 Tax=Hyella patelloides LEGE 07179 TaxID=945734 RepID=A0A563VM83_9CYAN|nr:hypothetical protein H1P_1530012 [Hyella patelloides LEGE 07179]